MDIPASIAGHHLDVDRDHPRIRSTEASEEENGIRRKDGVKKGDDRAGTSSSFRKTNSEIDIGGKTASISLDHRSDLDLR